MRKFQQLQALVQQSEKDAEKFFIKGNRAAGRRLRASMQQAKALAQDIRARVLSLGKERKALKRPEKVNR